DVCSSDLPGAALAAYHIAYGHERTADPNDALQGSYLGPAYGERDVLRVINRYQAVAHHAADEADLVTRTAEALHQGKVVGWFQGRMEFGPRALGNRSILGDPANPEMQLKLNQKIKFRESFRPFAPAVTEEDVARYFDAPGPSPYMLLVHPVREELREPLPAGYHAMD